MAPPAAFVLWCPWDEIENGDIVWGIGLLVFSLGLFFRVWSQMHLHYRLKMKMVLTTTGPYAYVRNPIYIGNTLILLGYVMMAELFWFVPIMFAYCMTVYTLVVRYEEAHLRKRFGAPYEEYMDKVPRWFPCSQTCRRRVSIGAKRFIRPSIAAELHCLIIILPAVIKELIR